MATRGRYTNRIWIALGGVAGLVAIIGVIVAIAQLWQAWAASTSQDVTQATVIAIMDMQLAVQREIATAQAADIESGPTATAVAERITQLVTLQETLEAERLRLEPTLTAVAQSSTAGDIPPPPQATTPAITFGQEVQLAVCPETIGFGETIQCSIDAERKIDTYTFEAAADDRILLRMTRTSETLNPRIRVFAPDEAQVCESYRERLAEVLNCALPRSGTYAVQVSDSTRDRIETGDYTLYLQRLNNPGNVIPISFGQTVSGAINRATEIDSYTFDGEVDDVILMRMTRASETLQPWIRVYAPDASQACESYSERLADMLNCTLPRSGTFAVLISDASRDRTETGDYTLYIQRLNDPGNATPIVLGQTLPGTIDLATKIDTYTFDGEVDDKVLFRLTKTSETLQPWLRVYAPDGKLSCEGFNERLAEHECILPRSGTYTILVSDGSRSRTEIGSYTLYLTQS